ncbi:hypothetical protein WJX64_09440 [Leifsonia sp. YIM 134122]|uniref:DUF559 domain-containing protein n=1 Tax=Leifsonia stereocauli TaxID=3134136 RepID=A0ABU9W439_9MICO
MPSVDERRHGRERPSGMRRPAPLPPVLATRPFTVADAEHHGVTRARTRANDLGSPFRGVRTATVPDDLEALCHAYAARMPATQYFSHSTGALLWEIPLPRRLEAESLLHVSSAAGSQPPRIRGTVGHRGARDAVIVRHRGLSVASPCDAWCQTVRLLSLDEAIIAGDRLVGWPRPLVTLGDLDLAIAAFGARPGARRIASARTSIRERSASARESRLRLVTMRGGFPEAELNSAIALSSGRNTHGDLVYRRYKVLLEYDGEQHRLDGRQFATDVNRLNDLSEDAWIVIRVGKHMSEREVLARLERALSSRGWTR